MASRFQKKTAPKLPSIPGTKPSLFNFQLLTSSGVPGLDQLFGGGLPLGTLLLLEDLPIEHEENIETGQNYSSLLCQYFLSEGVVHGHKLYLSQVPPGGMQLPAIVQNEEKSGDQSQGADEKMKIAWRYEGQAPTSEELNNKSRTHHFNLNKVVPDDQVSNLLHKFILEPRVEVNESRYNDLYNDLKKSLQDFAINPKVPATNILRIGITELGNCLYDSSSEHHENEVNFLKFLYKLRALARSHLTVIVLTISQDFFAKHEPNEHFHIQVKEMVDFVIDLTTFSKAKRQNGLFKDYHGLMELSKAAPLNCLVNSSNHNHIRSKYLFKSLRTKFSISPMHLPPDLGGDADEIKKATNSMNKLEF